MHMMKVIKQAWKLVKEYPKIVLYYLKRTYYSFLGKTIIVKLSSNYYNLGEIIETAEGIEMIYLGKEHYMLKGKQYKKYINKTTKNAEGVTDSYKPKPSENGAKN